MNSSPKIIVLKMREIIYTAVLFFLIVLLIVCVILMFFRKQPLASANDPLPETTESTLTASSTALYTPGIYTSQITLGESAFDVEVTVDSDQITGIRLVHLSESVAASYPLISSSLEQISTQILAKQSLTEITAPQENRYTSQILLSAVSDALTLAKNDFSAQ